MAEKKTRAGALQSELHIELHTNYAIGLWTGRKAEKGEDGKKGKQPIMGMPQFLHRATLINKDSLQNNPWADMAMLELEGKIEHASQEMKLLIDGLDKEKVLQASHYGVISRNQRYALLSDGSRLLREIYGCVLRYRMVNATRFDAVANNDLWR